MTLTEFLLARIAEDEAVARDCETGPPIVQALQVGMDHHEGVENGWVEIDPARVLADCEAKRRIVEEYGGEVERGPAGQRDDFVARHGGILDAYHVALRALASVYADHPGFREEWHA